MRHPHSSTPDHQIRLASEMIAHQRIYGHVSQLSREHQISRQWIYLLQAKGQKAMKREFGQKWQPTEQDLQIERSVLTLLTECHASREGIQRSLEVILGEHISRGKISEIIYQAGKRAQEYLKHQLPKGKRALALDEQYSSKRGEAYFNIVDVWSSLVLASIPPVAVDGESWTLLLWQIQEQGLQWKLIVSDGGKAIQDAVHKITPGHIHQRDVWHVLHECQKVQRRVNRSVDQLQEQTSKVERQAKRVAAGGKPRGKNPKTDMVAHLAELHQMEYVATSLCFLTSELQRLLSIIVLTEDGLLGTQARQEELDTLSNLFSELCDVTPKTMTKEIKRLFHQLHLALACLLRFCHPLDEIQHTSIN